MGTVRRSLGGPAGAVLFGAMWGILCQKEQDMSRSEF